MLTFVVLVRQEQYAFGQQQRPAQAIERGPQPIGHGQEIVGDGDQQIRPLTRRQLEQLRVRRHARRDRLDL